MFNRTAFNKAIERSGLRRRYIVDKMNISYKCFTEKTYGHAEWKLGEISTFCDVVGIGPEERDSIFFACNPTECSVEENGK